MRKRYRSKLARRPTGLRERIAEAQSGERARCPAPEHVAHLDEAGQEIPVSLFVRDGEHMLCSPCAEDRKALRSPLDRPRP